MISGNPLVASQPILKLFSVVKGCQHGSLLHVHKLLLQESWLSKQIKKLPDIGSDRQCMFMSGGGPTRILKHFKAATAPIAPVFLPPLLHRWNRCSNCDSSGLCFHVARLVYCLMNTATSPSCHAQIQPLLKSRTTKLRWGFYVVQMAWQQVCRGKLSNPWHVLTVSREWGCQQTWIVARGLPCSLAGQSAPTAPGGVLLFPHPSLSDGSHTTEPGYSHWQCHGLGMLAESEHEWMWVSVCTYKPLVSTG